MKQHYLTNILPIINSSWNQDQIHHRQKLDQIRKRANQIQEQEQQNEFRQLEQNNKKIVSVTFHQREQLKKIKSENQILFTKLMKIDSRKNFLGVDVLPDNQELKTMNQALRNHQQNEIHRENYKMLLRLFHSKGSLTNVQKGLPPKYLVHRNQTKCSN